VREKWALLYATFMIPRVSKLGATGLSLWLVVIGLWLLLPQPTLFPLYSPGSPITWIPEWGVAGLYLLTGGTTLVGCFKDSPRIAKTGLMGIVLLAIFIMMTYLLTLWYSIGVPTYASVAVLAFFLSISITKRELKVAFRNRD
jgi:hypothetical protein